MVQAARPSRVAVALRLRQRPIVDSCRTMRDSLRRFGHDEYLVAMDRLSSATSQGDEGEATDGDEAPGMGR